jgi:hypothetical protein
MRPVRFAALDDHFDFVSQVPRDTTSPVDPVPRMRTDWGQARRASIRFSQLPTWFQLTLFWSTNPPDLPGSGQAASPSPPLHLPPLSPPPRRGHRGQSHGKPPMKLGCGCRTDGRWASAAVLNHRHLGFSSWNQFPATSCESRLSRARVRGRGDRGTAHQHARRILAATRAGFAVLFMLSRQAMPNYCYLVAVLSLLGAQIAPRRTPRP